MTRGPAAVVPGLVSVITPCYNAAPFVGETIAAVRAQTHAPVEHLVIDDASTDASWAAIEAERERVGQRDRMRAVRLERNGGASHARNVGAGLARGEYLMFLDADDLLAPDTLTALVAAVRDQANALAICDWRRLEAVHGEWASAPPDVPLPERGADFLRGWIDETGWVPPCAVLWRRDHFERTGSWDESLTLNQDGDLMMRTLASGARLVHAEGGVAYYRRHSESTGSLSMDAYSEGKLRSRGRVYDKLAAELERQGRLMEYADSLGLACHRLAHILYIRGFAKLGHEYRRRGERLVGRRAISGTVAGRLLTAAIGMDAKEQLVQWLARHGISTRARRRTLERLSPAASNAPETGAELRTRTRSHP